MTMKFDTETIRLMTLFENLTGSQVKDCIVNENILYIVVEEGKLGIAIGKNGNSVKRAENVINKTIKLFEFSSDVVKFVKNLIPKVIEVNVAEGSEGKIVEVRVEKKDRPIIIGRDGKNLKIFKEFLKRNHDVNDLVIR